KTFEKLKNGNMFWSDINREDWQFVESEKKCIYCGSKIELSKEHIVPKSLKIKLECSSCDNIHGIHNQIWACKKCNLLKRTKGLYEFYKEKYPYNEKFYDIIPPLLEKKYLKVISKCHVCAGKFESKDLDGDGKLTVLDIDFIIHKFIK
ncbi:MAG: HNH endonuclease, partial [Thermoplasmata archaeon]